jgi:hypothetical protein
MNRRRATEQLRLENHNATQLWEDWLRVQFLVLHELCCISSRSCSIIQFYVSWQKFLEVVIACFLGLPRLKTLQAYQEWCTRPYKRCACIEISCLLKYSKFLVSYFQNLLFKWWLPRVQFQHFNSVQHLHRKSDYLQADIIISNLIMTQRFSMGKKWYKPEHT